MIVFHRLVILISLISLLYSKLHAQTTEGNGVIVGSSSANVTENRSSQLVTTFPESRQRILSAADNGELCDSSTKSNLDFKRYFDGMSTIYQGESGNTCLQKHMECGWPSVSSAGNALPLLVISVGLEGAGHHLWTEVLDEPVFDCVWVNARHYRRDIADGVPRATSAELEEGTTIGVMIHV